MEVKQAFANKIIKILFYYLFLFKYLVVQRQIEELGKLFIDPLAKMNIFFSMIDKNKKERLGEVLTRLGCGQNQRDFILFFYI